MATEKAKGVDVSKWQGSIDWKQVKASGVDFAMIRLGRGEYDGGPCALDTCFKQNIAGALEAGLDVGSTSTATPSPQQRQRPRPSSS